MSFNTIKSFIVIFFLIGLSQSCYGQSSVNERHLEVSLRMIGHKLLLSHGDSTSRVLPIEKVGDRYKISFDTIFEFQNEKLVGIVKEVVAETGIAQKYIVEVEDCLTRKIVYSYEMNMADTSNLVPCGLRPQPLGCYSLFFTSLDPIETPSETEEKSTPEKKSYLGAKIAIGAMILLLAFFLLMRKQPKEDDVEENKESFIVQIGSYRFDKNNLILSLEDSKEELTSKESDLLLLLLSSVNETIERDQILKAVWGDEGDYVGRTLDVFISKLRKRLQGDENIKIMNVRGVGYKLIINTP